MDKGIIYVMTTVVVGLIKIGKTTEDQFETRMRTLENNGYANITGLKRAFAIEVEEHDDKEQLIHEIFSKSRIANTELFALDVELVKSLLASLDGRQVYPRDKSKREVFEESTEERKLNISDGLLPDGEYFLNRRVKDFGKVDGKAVVRDGVFILLKGSYCGNMGSGYVPPIMKEAKIKDNVLQEDLVCKNPSGAGWVVIGKSNNGWIEWKDKNGNPIDIYRKS